MKKVPKPQIAKQINTPPEQLQLLNHRPPLTIVDWIAAPVLLTITAIMVFKHIGTAIGWDDLLYMNLAQYTTPQTWVLNRYAHVYLQKFFYWLANDAITGTRIFWCVQYFTTTLLIYWSAKILAGRKNYPIAILAVALFFAQTFFAQHSGCTDADLTVMLFIMIAVFLVLAFPLETCPKRHIIITLLGLLFFAAVKSKETGVCLAVVFLALGRVDDNNWQLKRFIKDIALACIGIAAGSLILMTLDAIFLKDFFFSIKFKNIDELFSFNWMETKVWAPMTFYTYISKTPLFFTWLLFLLVGFKLKDIPKQTTKMLIWAIPLAVLFFVKASRLSQSHWHIVSRYFTPGTPILCIFAAQFFKFDLAGKFFLRAKQTSLPKIIPATAVILIAIATAAAFNATTPNLATKFGLENAQQFYANATMPLALTILLACSVVLDRKKILAVFISSFCAYLLIVPPISENYKLLKSELVAKQSQQRYMPYQIFADQIQFNKDMKVLVSKDIYASYRMLGRNYIPHSWMFNVFFNQKYPQDQFIDGTTDDIAKADYTYGFITRKDWQKLNDTGQTGQLIKTYTIIPDKSTPFILLKKL